MSTTHDAYILLSTLSDLEVRLFSAPVGQAAANSSAFVEQVIPGRRVQAANVRAFLPDPPQSSLRGGLVESVLLRAA